MKGRNTMAELKEIKDVKDIKGDKEEYDPRRKREVIKTILIIFLAALLVLLFCSNTIMNKSLPQITTERTTSGKLTERLRGSGMVLSNQTYGVTVDGNKVIDTINVKVGKEVEEGDVLMVVGTGESEAAVGREPEHARPPPPTTPPAPPGKEEKEDPVLFLCCPLIYTAVNIHFIKSIDLMYRLLGACLLYFPTFK